MLLLFRLAQIRRPILELGELVQEHQFDLPYRTVALFGQKQFRLSRANSRPAADTPLPEE
jgi:hypothetical protein